MRIPTNIANGKNTTTSGRSDPSFPARSLAQMEGLEGRLLLASHVTDDEVLKWNEVAINAIRADRTQLGPTWVSRNMAILHAAIFDAVNGIDRSYEPYLVTPNAPKDASIPAAAAAAAATALAGLYPQQRAYFHAELNQSLAVIPDGPSENQGVAWGRQVAVQILNARQNDGASNIVPFTPGTDPGEWRPTWPDYSPALGANWYQVRPFAIASGAQFRPPPPPALTSGEYAKAFNEVKRLGERDSQFRTPEQTEIGIFWAYDRIELGTPVVLYNQAVHTIAHQENNTLIQNARLFALVNIAMGDSGISAWDAKYYSKFWRPITGIWLADTDGNPHTVADPGWKPLGAPGGGIRPDFTPPFPAYVSGHSTFGAATFKVLADFYGTDNISFTLTSDELPGITRSYRTFSQAIEENGISRIYLGIHWQFDNSWGKAMGRAIGDYVYDRILQPVDPPAQLTSAPAPALSSAVSSTQPIFSTRLLDDSNNNFLNDEASLDLLN